MCSRPTGGCEKVSKRVEPVAPKTAGAERGRLRYTPLNVLLHNKTRAVCPGFVQLRIVRGR